MEECVRGKRQKREEGVSGPYLALQLGHQVYFLRHQWILIEFSFVPRATSVEATTTNKIRRGDINNNEQQPQPQQQQQQPYRRDEWFDVCNAFVKLTCLFILPERIGVHFIHLILHQWLIRSARKSMFKIEHIKIKYLFQFHKLEAFNLIWDIF